MMLLKKLAKQSSHYIAGELIVAVLSFISFPIFTRIFTQEEYGTLNLVTISVTMIYTVVTGGFSPAILRFYPESKKSGEDNVRLFYSTINIAVFLISAIGIVCLVILSQIEAVKFLNPESKEIILYASILVLYRVLTATIRNFLQCEERTILFNVSLVLERLTGLVFALIFVLYLQLGVSGFFIGLIIGEGLIFATFYSLVLKRLGSKFFRFSWPLLIQNIRYGLPLLVSKFANFLNNSGNRYLIEYFLGTASVAVFGVGMTLVIYIQDLTIIALNKALIPMTMRLYTEKGKGETGHFLTRFINLYAFFAIPVVFGLTAVGENLIIAIASDKYAESAQVIFLVASALMLAGAYFPLHAGLYLQKRTITVATILFMGAIVNLVITTLLLPRMGIRGAALGLLFGDIVYILIGYLKSSKFIKVKIDFISILKITVFSLIMYVTISYIDSLIEWSVLLPVFQTVLGCIIYFTLVALFEKKAIATVKEMLFPKYSPSK